MAIKYVSMINQQGMVRPTLIDLKVYELLYFRIIICMNIMCDESCNTIEDPFGRICTFNRIEGVNLKVFNMSKEINLSKTLSKHISCECRCEFDDRKCNSRQKRKNDKC